MDRQRKLSKLLGKDTHVRSQENDMFKSQSFQTFEIKTGEVFLNQPEPFFIQNAVTIDLSKGGKIPGVPLPGGFIDPITGNLHGSYEGFIPGQMVTVGFIDGNSAAPIILNRYPYQGKGNTALEPFYKLPMFKAGYDFSDVILGHFTGSKISLNTGIFSGKVPASISIEAFTECNITANTTILVNALVSAEVKSALAKLTGSVSAEISAPLVKIDGTATVEINGNTKQFVTHAELDLALQTFITALNLHIHTTTATIGASSTPGVISPPVTPMTLDITAAKTIKTLTGG
jgi:hypothetical protein